MACALNILVRARTLVCLLYEAINVELRLHRRRASGGAVPPTAPPFLTRDATAASGALTSQKMQHFIPILYTTPATRIERRVDRRGATRESPRISFGQIYSVKFLRKCSAPASSLLSTTAPESLHAGVGDPVARARDRIPCLAIALSSARRRCQHSGAV